MISRLIRVIGVHPCTPHLVAWAGADPEARMRSTNIMAAFRAGWEARDAEVAALRAEISRLEKEAAP